MDFMALQRAHELDVYPKRPVTIVRGQGARVWDDRGREYIDCVSGHGVSNLGHGPPRIVEAIREQAGRLITLSNVFYNDERARLLARLASVTPPGLSRAFLCNSGAESIEAAIKFARLVTGRTELIAAMRGFHGRTYGALSATFKSEYREPFEPLVPGFHFVPFNDCERLEAVVGDTTAGVILEPIQGEAGVHVGDAEYFRCARRLCDERGALLVMDEVQTGFGRTGAMFACEHFGVVPDILCLAKAMGSGMPIGAVACSDRVSVPVGRHGSTFGGNPLSCAAARATIDVLVEEDLAARARLLGDRLVERLRRAAPAKMREVRHMGLMVGVELREKVAPHILALLEEGLLVFPAGATVIRVYPPLTIEEGLVDAVADRLAGVLA